MIENFRLHYLDIAEKKNSKQPFGVIDMPFIQFVAPEGMTKEEVFKVVSYISSKIDEEKLSTLAGVKAADEMLNSFHFHRLHGKAADDCIEIFTVDGDKSQFNKTKYKGKWESWFYPDVQKEEVEEIYAKNNLKFPSHIFQEKERQI